LVSATVLAVTGGPGLVRAAATNSHPAPQPAVRVVLPSLNFGSTIIGKRVSQTVSVANPENSFVNISQPNVSISRISLSGLALPFSLPVEQSGRFQDRFDATSTGNATGTVPIETYSGISLEPLARTDGHVHSGCDRHDTHDLSMAEEWVRHQRGNVIRVHNSGNHNFG
jgi:hypothetical protein